MNDNRNSEKQTNKPRRQERLRILVQAFSFAFHNGYVMGWVKKGINTNANKTFCLPGLNCYSCPGAIAACPIGSLQAVLDSGTMKVSLYVLGFIVAVGLLCGRFVCGWLCPFGAVQDLLYRIPLFKKVKNLPGHKYIRWLKYVVLVLFVVVLPMVITGPSGTGQPWFCEWICPAGTLLGGIPLVVLNPGLRTEVGFRFAWKVAVLLLVLIGSVKLYRPFCKYLCPLGALYGGCNKLSLYRLTVDKEKCIACGACQKACGMDIPVWQKPNSIECIRCGKCMAACPTGAVSSTWKDLWKKKPALDSNPDGGTSARPSREISQAAPVLSNPVPNRKWRIAIGTLLLLLSAGTLIYNGYMLVMYLCAGPFDHFISFVVYMFGNLYPIFAGACGIVYAVKLLKCLKSTERDTEMRELAKMMSLTVVICCVLMSLSLILALVASKGLSMIIIVAGLKHCGAFAGFWVAIALVIALSARLFPKSKSIGA